MHQMQRLLQVWLERVHFVLHALTGARSRTVGAWGVQGVARAAAGLVHHYSQLMQHPQGPGRHPPVVGAELLSMRAGLCSAGHVGCCVLMAWRAEMLGKMLLLF